MAYNTKEIEKKWQNFWETRKIFKSSINHERQKYYVLEMYPYPSGELHMGHVRCYILGDVVARYKRMKGFNVLHPIGWDAFGLPTENAAFLRKIEPSEWNLQCTERMEKQFRSLGISYDWDRIIDTSEQDYYKWTQWFLIHLWEKGLLYQDKMMVNWCTMCNTVLANEQVDDGTCCHCSSVVVQKEMEQWFLRITAYADRLWDDIRLLTEWPERVVSMQRHWIGRDDDRKYKLRDWCISRQRYWGAPIPFVICERCGVQPVPKEQLPVVLPKGADITPGWPPPLARIRSFVQTVCPACHGQAERVTDTLDTFVFSAWYFLRFVDPHNEKAPFDTEVARYWMPVDQYVGGIEHATVHLVYARFFHKVLFDIGLVSNPEPFRRLFTQGMVCKDGMKMSKSKGNVVTPDELLTSFGADTIRLYTLFLGPPELDVEWTDNGIKGCWRFLTRVINTLETALKLYQQNWRDAIGSVDMTEEHSLFQRKTHQAIKKVTEAIDQNFHFHTSVSALMTWVASWGSYLAKAPNPALVSEATEALVLLLSPFTPHLSEEFWQRMGNMESVSCAGWPDYNEDLCIENEVEIVIQLNGKTRARITMSYTEGAMQDKVEEKALARINVLCGATPAIKKVIFIPRRLVNFVLSL